MKLHPWKGKELKSSIVPSSHMASLFWVLALGGWRWDKTSACVASLLLIPLTAAHLGEGLLREVPFHPQAAAQPLDAIVAAAAFVPVTAEQTGEGHRTVFLEGNMG